MARGTRSHDRHTRGPTVATSPQSGFFLTSQVGLVRTIRLSTFRQAFKIPPDAFSNDPERLSRFEREAKAVSSLNHPHICTLHDIGNDDGIRYMVMELIEGETLQSRLARKALSFVEALEYAIQIADALACAHAAGVVHRDLKPGNVMLTKSGVKLLDFGLAKVQREDSGASVDSETPTQQKDLTSQGAVLGTFRYMSPEQLEGREIDERTDIFAFGAVLYEMVTGKKAFDGASEASLIVAIMDSEPDSITTSKALDWIVRTAIAKEPDDRWSSMHDVKLQLRRLSIVEEPEATQPSPRSSVLAWGVAAVSAMAFVVALMSGNKSSPSATKRFAIYPPETAAFTWQDSPEISPDGSLLAFVAENAAGIRHLWIRPLDDLEARELPGTDGAQQPFWKPNSRSLGFFAGGDMKRIEIDGTALVTLAAAPVPKGATWNRNGTIVFTPGGNRTLSAISDSSDGLRQLGFLDTDRDEFLHRYPVFLPDGSRFLFVVQAAGPENSGLFVGSVDSELKKKVGPMPSRAVFVPPDHILFRGEAALMAQRFDLGRLELTGDPFVVGEAVAGARTFGGGELSVSENGVVVFRPQTTSLSRLVWVDRKGDRLRNIGEPAEYNSLDLAADGTRILVEVLAPETRMGDVWILDDSRDTATRITHDSDWEFDVSWSRDDAAIRVVTARGAYRLSLATGEKEFFDIALSRASISPDGSFTVGLIEGELWVLPMVDRAQPRPYLETPFQEEYPRISPDGKWLAYSSNESGRNEVYVQSFPEPGWKVLISNVGGEQPIWKNDGTELFYLEGGRRLMAVPIDMGGVPDPGLPKLLFETPIIGGVGRYHYDVSADAERFIAIVPVEDAATTPLQVILDWMRDDEP